MDTIDLIEFMDRGQIEFIESNHLESAYILPNKNVTFLQERIYFNRGINLDWQQARNRQRIISQ